MRTVAVVQARLGSTRLPGKVLYELAGRPMILMVLDRVSRATGLDDVILATGEGEGNDALDAVVSAAGYRVVRGPEDDVLARYRIAAEAAAADLIVRVTGDCPFIDPGVLDALLALRAEQGADYATNVKPETWPDGLDASVFTSVLLQAADREARLPSEREHVVPWMWEHCAFGGGDRFSCANLAAPRNLAELRWTVDDGLDYLLARAIVGTLGHDASMTADWQQILEVFQAQPSELLANQSTVRDAGYLKSLETERAARR